MPDSLKPDEPTRGPKSTGHSAKRSAWATFGVFAMSGLLLSSWISRIPSVRAALHVDPGKLGLVLLSTSAGAVLALPGAGPIVGKLGTRRTVVVAASLSCIGSAVVALASKGPVALLAAGLFLLGMGFGAWDVAMNVEGAAVEQALGRTIMPRFHAGFSLGTVFGALIGAGVEALGVPVRPHLLVVAVVGAIAVPLCARYFLPDEPQPATTEDRATAAREIRSPWRERRTLMIGLFVLVFAFTEGTANDWLAVATVSGYHQSASFGSLVYASFVAAMTLGRLVSTRLLDRFGRVAVLSVSCGVAAIGVGCVVAGPTVAFDLVGAAFWGLGASTGFPVGMSAAADDPTRSHARVGAVSTVAYTAFLAGPPLIGFLGDHIGVRHALAVTGVLAIVGLGLVGNTRPEPSVVTLTRTSTSRPVAERPPV